MKLWEGSNFLQLCKIHDVKVTIIKDTVLKLDLRCSNSDYLFKFKVNRVLTLESVIRPIRNPFLGSKIKLFKAVRIV